MILVMQNGAIVQTGDYNTLSQQKGLFSDMLQANQALDEANKGNLDAWSHPLP